MTFFAISSSPSDCSTRASHAVSGSACSYIGSPFWSAGILESVEGVGSSGSARRLPSSDSDDGKIMFPFSSGLIPESIGIKPSSLDCCTFPAGISVSDTFSLPESGISVGITTFSADSVCSAAALRAARSSSNCSTLRALASSTLCCRSEAATVSMEPSAY